MRRLIWFALSAFLLTVAATAALLGLSRAAAGQTITIAIGDNWFCDPTFENGVCETIVDPGTTVTWDYASGNTLHTSTECGDSLDVCDPPERLWQSGILILGDSFSFTFNTVGTYLYRCQIHPQAMRGRIVVQATPPSPPPDGDDDGPATDGDDNGAATNGDDDAPASTNTRTPTPPPSETVSPEPSPSPSVAAALALPSGGGLPPDSPGLYGRWSAIAAAIFILLATMGVTADISHRRRRPR